MGVDRDDHYFSGGLAMTEQEYEDATNLSQARIIQSIAHNMVVTGNRAEVLLKRIQDSAAELENIMQGRVTSHAEG